ncbi:hypothetical protein, partial [Peribacillus muralis]|uniref:hypothetical protein n=1 Tax=Peribacillus muralis TaxID=264697 RepID=UPI003D00D248
LFQSTKKMTTSDIFGTAEYNAYLAAFNETRSVTYATALTGSGFVDDYDYVPHRAKGFYGDYINKNPGSPGLHVYIKPLTGGEVRITRNETTDDFRPLRAQYLYSQRLDSNPSATSSKHIYIGATDEVRISTAPGLENTTGILRAGSIFASSITLNNLGNGSHLNLLLVGSDSEVRVKHSADDSYRPIRARTFTTDTSMRENKKDIEVFSEDSLSIFRNAQIYTYRRKTDDQYAFKQLGMMIDETPRILHGEIGDSFDLYALTSYMGKGIKDIISVLDLHSDDINWLKLENQYLKQKIKILEEKVA